MSLTAILLWLLAMLGFGGPVCGDPGASTMQLTSTCVTSDAPARVQARPQFTNDISNGI